MTAALSIAALGGAALLVGGGTAYALTSAGASYRTIGPNGGLLQGEGWDLPPPPGQEYAVRDAVIETIIRVRVGRSIRALSRAPSDARRIDVRGMQSTPWSDVSPRDAWTTRAGMIDALGSLRRLMADAGRADEDVRCYWSLLRIECGPTGRHCWRKNVGNYKANWTIYASADSLRAHYAMTRAPYADSLWCAKDRVMSSDLYWGYPDWNSALQHHKQLFQWSNYAGVLPGYRRGGLEGLVAAERALALGGYTGGETRAIREAKAVTREARARNFWAHCARIAVDAWVR